MRKTAILAALGVVLGAAVAAAQAPVQGAPQQGRAGGAWQGGRRGGAGGMDAMLLKGISLSDAQKANLKKLRADERASMARGRGQGQNAMMDQIRAARQRGDTATARKLMREARSAMEAQRQQRIAAVRAILTPNQQAQFDQNAATMKQKRTKFQAGRQ